MSLDDDGLTVADHQLVRREATDGDAVLRSVAAALLELMEAVDLLPLLLRFHHKGDEVRAEHGNKEGVTKVRASVSSRLTRPLKRAYEVSTTGDRGHTMKK